MDSRERTFLALNHEAPDRIPVDFWASPSFRQRLESELGMPYDRFLEENEIDFRYIPGPRYVGPSLEGEGEGFSVDIWGVPRKLVTLDVRGHTEHYREVIEPPLVGASSVEDIEDYPHWPSPDWFDYGDVEAQCDGVRDRGFVVVFMGDRLNRVAQLKPAMYIRGAEQVMLDLALQPAFARALFARIRRFYLEYMARILDAANGKIDIVLTGDDFGAQNGPLMSGSMWNKLLKSGFREYVSLIKTRGAVAMHHTCGSVVEIIPEMTACGLDVLQSVQPEARGMDPVQLKASFGDRLSFHGGVSVQRTLPYGTPADVRREVRKLAEIMGQDGGYIFCTAHNIQADTPMENLRALIESYRRYR